MGPTDIASLVSVGRPALSPDGGFVVFAASRPDLDADRAVGQLWGIDLPHGTPRRLTRGVADRAPRLSPDGARIAFLREDDEGRPQVFVVAAAGGEPVQATDLPLGVTEAVWSPDGAVLALVARVPEAGRYGTVPGRDAAAEPARRITGIRWHANGLGYVLDRPAHVFVVRAPETDAEPFYPPAPTLEEGGRRRVVAAEPRQLTSGEGVSYGGVVFSADGGEVLAIAERLQQQHPDLRDAVVALRADGEGRREVVEAAAGLGVTDIAVAADGTVALLAHELGQSGVDLVAPGTALWLAEDAGVRRLTDAATLDLGETGSHLTVAGDDVLVQDRARGRVRLLRVSRSGEVTEVLGGDVEIVGHASAGGVVAASVVTPSSAGELMVIDGAGARAMTSFGARIAAAGLVTPREVTVSGRDGYPVHGWVATPEGEGPFPAILQIHGGPYASYGVALFDETQVLTDAGYAVVYCNPRGSAGYGRAHGRAIRGAMGTVDADDVIDFLDGAVADDPRLDGDRVGVMGGSYGGYLTAWLIAHDHRFAGAIVERGMLDPASFQGTSDIGTTFGDEYIGVDAADIARQSPMAVVDRVSTPTLVIHSELDLRCPLEQATRYYAALKRRGVEAELLIFPGENHELSRSGRPRHRVERFEAILEWWARRLPVS